MSLDTMKSPSLIAKILNRTIAIPVVPKTARVHRIAAYGEDDAFERQRRDTSHMAQHNANSRVSKDKRVVECLELIRAGKADSYDSAAAEMKVAYPTARRYFDELEDDGLICRVSKRGRQIVFAAVEAA